VTEGVTPIVRRWACSHQQRLLAADTKHQSKGCLYLHLVLSPFQSATELRLHACVLLRRQVLQRHATSWRLLKMYARFLEVVKNDPWSASKWNA
jgi:hypothetical protein